MKHEKAAWTAAYKKAVEDRVKAGNSLKPTEDTNCALASIRVIRDGLVKAIEANGKEFFGSEEAVNDAKSLITDELNELIKSVQAEKLYGFASNSSAAAKAAGLESAKTLSEFAVAS